MSTPQRTETSSSRRRVEMSYSRSRSRSTSRSPARRPPAPVPSMLISSETLKIDVTMEAETTLRRFGQEREKDVAARKAMFEEVDRVIKLIRDLRRLCDTYMALNQTNKSDELLIKLEIIDNTIKSILLALPKEYLPENSTASELDRVEAAITEMLKALKETDGELIETKQEVAGLNKEVEQVRDAADKLQKLLDEAECRLRDIVGETGTRMPLIDLIKAAEKLLKEEKKKRDETERALPTEKKKMDSLLERRRELLAILKQLFEKCAETDRLTRDVGLQSVMECPKDINEKQPIASEFDRALSWLIERISAMIAELRRTKQRMADGEEKLRRAERVGKDGKEQMKRCQETLRRLGDKMEELKKKLNDVGDLKAQTQRKNDGLQDEYNKERQNLESQRDQARSQWQKMATDYDETSRNLQKELEQLRRDVIGLRERNVALNSQADRALREYQGLKDKLDAARRGHIERNREKEANLRKLSSDVAATESQAKQAEREADDYGKEADKARKDLNRRSDLVEQAKNRCNDSKVQRDKRQAELANLLEEGKQLQGKIKNNERALELAQNRHKEMQGKLADLSKRKRQLENENQELRWSKDGKAPGSRKERRPCPRCTKNAEVSDDLINLRRESEQLKQQRDALLSCEETLKRQLEELKDRRANTLPPRSPDSQASERIPVAPAQRGNVPETARGRNAVEAVTGRNVAQTWTSRNVAETRTDREIGETPTGRKSQSIPRASSQASSAATPRRASSTRTINVAAAGGAMARKEKAVRRSRESRRSTGRTWSNAYARRTRVSTCDNDDDESDDGGNINMTVTVNVVNNDESSAGGSSLTATEEGYDDNSQGQGKK